VTFWQWVQSLFQGKNTVTEPQPTAQSKPQSSSPSTTSSTTEYSWIVRALSKEGEKEFPGSAKNNSWIVSLFKWTGYATKVDETAWCAAFVSWCHDIKGSAAAIWFATWGRPSALVHGATVVLQHTTGGLKGHHHVTFCLRVINYVSDTDFSFQSIGGNQGDTVNRAIYTSANYKIVAKRFPIGTPATTTTQTKVEPSTKVQKLAWETGDASRVAWSAKVRECLLPHLSYFDAARDVEDYHPSYRALTKEQRLEVWAAMCVAISKFESAWRPADAMTESTGAISQGLFQLTYGDSYCPKSKSEGDLNDPITNIRCAIAIMGSLVKLDGVIASGGYTAYGAPAARGIARYWSVIRVPDTKSKHHKSEIQSSTRSSV
jgi:hypothetical protein